MIRKIMQCVIVMSCFLSGVAYASAGGYAAAALCVLCLVLFLVIFRLEQQRDELLGVLGQTVDQLKRVNSLLKKTTRPTYYGDGPPEL